MDNIYLPVDSVDDFACYVVQSSNTIRAYYTQPRLNGASEYIDFHTDNHYFETTGTQSWGQYGNLPTCLSKTSITNDYFYRTDFADSLLIFFILFTFIFYFPFKIVSRLFGRWLKL